MINMSCGKFSDYYYYLSTKSVYVVVVLIGVTPYIAYTTGSDRAQRPFILVWKLHRYVIHTCLYF